MTQPETAEDPDPLTISAENFASMALDGLRAAELMFNDGLYQQAYYHSGLSVEFALKCRIMRFQRFNTWPSRTTHKGLYVHNLASLANQAGLRDVLLDALMHDPGLAVAWQVVKDWDINTRYDPRPFPKVRAADMLAMVRDRGLVRWLIGL